MYVDTEAGTESQTQLWSSDISLEIIRERDTHMVGFLIRADTLTPIEPQELPCWVQLYKAAVLVYYDKWITEAHGYGLKINLQRMTDLAGAQTLVNHDDGLVFMGLNSMLVPVKQLDGIGGLQWHFVKLSGNDPALSSFEEITIPKQLKRVAEESIWRAQVHFLGLWESAVVTLATKETLERHPKGRPTIPTKAKVKKRSIQLQGGSISLSTATKPGVTPTLNYIVVDETIQRQPGEVHLTKTLQTYASKPLIMYDQNERIAWLPQTLSVVLHAAQLNIRANYPDVADDVLTDLYAKAETNGGKAAFAALHKRLNREIDAMSEDKKHKLTLGHLVELVCLQLQRMKIQPRTRGRVRCYEFADLVNLDMKVSLKKSDRSWKTLGWTQITERVLTLISHDLGEMILPEAGKENGWTTAPKGINLLVAPIRSLLTIAQNEGQETAEFDEGALGKGWTLVSRLHPPFGPCGSKHGHHRDKKCYRIQHLQKNFMFGKIVPLKNLTDRCDGAILIGASSPQAPNAEGPNNIEAKERNQAEMDQGERVQLENEQPEGEQPEEEQPEEEQPEEEQRHDEHIFNELDTDNERGHVVILQNRQRRFGDDPPAPRWTASFGHRTIVSSETAERAIQAARPVAEVFEEPAAVRAVDALLAPVGEINEPTQMDSPMVIAGALVSRELAPMGTLGMEVAGDSAKELPAQPATGQVHPNRGLIRILLAVICVQFAVLIKWWLL
jgi:hypothetical protein